MNNLSTTASQKDNATDLLLDTKDSFRDVREKIVHAMQNLFKVHESKIWESVASSWGEYVESELGISQGFASKLLSVNRHYLIEAGLYPEKLEGIDYEKLYLAAKTEGSVEEQLARAKTLTRAELKQEKNEKDPHTPNFVELCTECYVSKANHN